MIQPVNAQDPALQPAGAAARQVDAGIEATRRALDEVQGEGRLAVQLIQHAAEASVSPDPRSKGGTIDLTA